MYSKAVISLSSLGNQNGLSKMLPYQSKLLQGKHQESIFIRNWPLNRFSQRGSIENFAIKNLFRYTKANLKITCSN